MALLIKLRQKLFPIVTGLIVVAVAFLFETTSQPNVATVRSRLNSLIYDMRLQIEIISAKPIAPANSDIIIIDVDEKSLKDKGRWPWSREIVATLLEKLRENGAIVIAFDVIFAEPEKNLADDIMQELLSDGIVAPELNENIQQYKQYLDNDKEFADIIALQDDVVLGFILSADPTNIIGELPTPIMTLTPSEEALSELNNLPGQIANIALLQQSAKNGGFVTTISDADGIIRHAPLVVTHKDSIYPSLGLAAVMQYYFVDKLDLKFIRVGEQLALDKIIMGDKTIETDSYGQILIPFKGFSNTFPYVSASDVLNDNVEPDLLNNKIVFIGASAIGLGDLHATPFETSFPGVEIHATVADALLHGSFASIPEWALGAKIFTIIFIGVIFAIMLPFLSLIWTVLLPTATAIGIAAFSMWIYSAEYLYLSTISIYLMLIGLVIVNITHALIFESHKRQQLKEMFGQYVPPAHVEKMSESDKQYSFEGESREMSVLFADIRSFTSISEKLEASQVKTLLNQYFTPMTKIIFDNAGTIDKYVGDMIMAFWGAPMDNKNHALDSVKSGFAMLEMADQMTGQFKEMGIEAIHIGVGVNSGTMNVGDMGSTYRRSYTVLGDAVNLASRLESSTKFYHADFIISKNTLEGCRGEVIARYLDKVKVIGKDEAIEIYQPICMKDKATPELLAELKAQSSALDLYFDRRWDEALATFEKLKANYPDIPLYTLYIERILALKENDPGEGWDGCYVRVTK